MAERVGFEPTVGFTLRSLSRRAPSSTRPSLQMAEGAGFEPAGSFDPAVFKTAALNHSATPP